MTFDEAMVAAQLELPVILTYIDGCARVELEYKKITQVGYSFKNGVQSEFVQVLEKNGGSVCNARLQDVRVKDESLSEGRIAV